MSEQQENRSSSPGTTESPAFREVLEQVSNTREMRQLAGNLIPELIRLWAVSGTSAGMARSAFRKSVASAAGSSIKNALLDDRGLAEAPGLHTLAGDSGFTHKASAQAGEMVKGALDVLVKAAGQISGLDATVKKDLIKTVIRDLSTGQSAALITVCCRVINDIHRDEPEFLARVLAPEFEKWLKNLDFGELKELLESGSPGISALIRMVNATLWNYPAKVISTLALVPSVINIVLDALAQAVGTFNEKGSPDLVADVMLSVLRETDARAIGRLINELAEMTKRLHVGSALIGEPGSPLLPKDVGALIETVLSETNGAVLWKARAALAELKEQAGCALTDVMADHPELLTSGIATKSAVHNARIRSLSHRLSMLESFDPEALNNALGQALAGLDVQEGVNIINASALLLTRLLEDRPDELQDKAASLVDALDTDALSELLEKTGAVVGGALLPLARATVPHLTRGVLKALAADDDAFEYTAKAARQLLIVLLKDGEAANNG